MEFPLNAVEKLYFAILQFVVRTGTSDCIAERVWVLSLCDVPNIKAIPESSSWLCGAMPLNISLDQLICVKTSSVFGWYPCAIRVRVYTMTWCGIQFPADSAFPLAVFIYNLTTLPVTRDDRKAVPLQGRTGPESSRRLMLPDFKTACTWRW